MKECEGCGKPIDDKYKVCIGCLNKTPKKNDDGKILEKLTHMNWNLRRISKDIRLYILFKICSNGGYEDDGIRNKIFEYFSKDFEKEIGRANQIGKEVKNVS